MEIREAEFFYGKQIIIKFAYDNMFFFKLLSKSSSWNAILSFWAKNLENLTSSLNVLMKTKYEEISFIKVLELYIMRNIAFVYDHSFAFQFGSVGH